MAEINDRYLEDLIEELRKNTEALEGSGARASRSSRIRGEVEEGTSKAAGALKNALAESSRSLNQFGRALMDSSRSGLDKYTASVETAGDAAQSLGKAFGKTGIAVGQLAQGFATLTVAILKQTNSVLKSADELTKFGAIGEITSKELLNLSHNAGYSSKNLESLVKITKSLGTDVLVLGNNVNEGVRTFMKLAEANDEQLMNMRKLGITQQDFNQRQADYFKLQVVQGRSLALEVNDRAKLRKATEDYTYELAALSKLTGESVESIAQQQRIFFAQEDFNARVAGLEAESFELKQKALQLDKEGNTARAAELRSRDELLRKEIEGYGRLAPFFNSLDPKTAAGIKSLFATGGIPTTKEAQMVTVGLPGIQEAMEEFKRTSEPSKLIKAISEGMQQNYRQFGGENRLLSVSPEARELFQAYAKNAEFVSKYAGKSQEEIKKIIEDMKAGKGAAAQDPARKTQATIEAVERNVQIGMDKVVMQFNPFTKGLTASTGLLGAFSLALVGAIATLGAMSGRNMLRVMRGKAPIPPGVDARALGGLGKYGGKLVKGAGVVGTVAATAGAVGTFNDASEKLKKGEITEKEAGQQKGGAIGDALGGIGGMAGGALLGAKLGIFGGPLGSLIGGIVGGIAGSLAIGKVGEVVGGALSGKDNQTSNDESKRVNESSLEKKALGGIVTRPSIAGEAGPEAVVPLPGNRKIPVEIKGGGDGGGRLETAALNAELQKTVFQLSRSVTLFSTSVTSMSSVMEEQSELYEKLNSELSKLAPDGGAASGGSGGGIGSKISEFLSSVINKIKGFVGGGQPTSQATSTPTSYLQKVAQVESGGRAGIKAEGSSATGLFQFTGETWKDVVKKMGKDWSLEDRTDPTKATQAAAFLTDQNRMALQKSLGRGVGDTDLYMAHFLGAGGASNFLSNLSKNPAALASTVAGQDQITANKSIFYKDPKNETGMRTLQEVYDLMNEKLGTASKQIAEGNTTEHVKNISVPSASDGGIVSGPASGYAAVLHGKEAIIPLESTEVGKRTGNVVDALNAITGANKSLASMAVDKAGVAGPQAQLMEAGMSRIAGKMLDKIPGMSELKAISGGMNTVNTLSDIASNESLTPGSKAWQFTKNLTGYMGPKGKVLSMLMEGAEMLYGKIASEAPRPVGIFKPELNVGPSESDTSSNTIQNTSNVTNVSQRDEMIAFSNMISEMMPRLDAMIEKLSEGNDIADKQLRYVRS